MATATVYTGATYPTGNPGALSATYLTTARGIAELSSLQRATLMLLVYGSGPGWWPVLDENGAPVLLTVDGMSKDPVEAALKGNVRRTWKIDQPAHYLLWRTSSVGDIASAFLSEASEGGIASADTKLVDIGAPVAAGVALVHANYGGDQANAFPGPFTNPDVPRNATVTFPAGWTGGNITLVGTDQWGVYLEELFTAVAGSTVAGLKIFKTITAASKGAVGAANNASIGIGVKYGMKDQLKTIQIILDGTTLEAPSATSFVDYWFTPTTAANGVHTYKLLGSK